MQVQTDTSGYLFISDSHIVSKESKGSPLRKPRGLVTRLVKNRFSLGIIDRVVVPMINGASRGSNLRPSLPVDQFVDAIPRVAERINDLAPKLVVFGGDFADASIEGPNRDRTFQSDVEDAARKFKDATCPPVLFLAGNSDALDPGQMQTVLGLFKELNNDGWNAIKDQAEFVDDQYSFGNFTIKTSEVLIIGLNSVYSGEFQSSDTFNKNYLTRMLKAHGQDVPVIVYTHHSPVNVYGMLNFAFNKIGEGIPAQKFIVSTLEKHKETTHKPAIVVNGHCHVQRYVGKGLSTVCNPPFSLKSRHIGTITNPPSEINALVYNHSSSVRLPA